jgi:outer membrane lipoprotein-sorting protein
MNFHVSRRLGAAVAGLLCAMLAIASAGAEDADPARALLDRIKELNHTTRKWTDSTQEISVNVVSRGREKKQKMRLLTKKYGEDATRTVVSFLEPPAIRGISVLQFVEAHKPNVTWLYSPELDRPRQYNGSSQRDSFSATDFSYEDLSIRGEIAEWTPEEASATLIRDEDVDGHACAVIEIVPKTVDITYKKVRLWVDRGELIVRKFQFEDDNGRLAKTLSLSDIRAVGAVPTAHRMEMVNERYKSRTIVVFDTITYDQGLDDSVFSQRYFDDES